MMGFIPLTTLGWLLFGMGSKGFYITSGLGFLFAWVMQINWKALEVRTPAEVPVEIANAIKGLLFSGAPIHGRKDADSTSRKIHSSGGTRSLLIVKSVLPIHESQCEIEFEINDRYGSRTGTGLLTRTDIDVHPLYIQKVNVEKLMDDGRLGIAGGLLSPLIFGALGYYYDALIPALGLSGIFCTGMLVFSFISWMKCQKARALKNRLNLTNEWILSYEGGWIAGLCGLISKQEITDRMVIELDLRFKNIPLENVVLYALGNRQLILAIGEKASE